MSGKSVPAPNYTQTPNVFFDEVLPEIDSLAELKVTLAIFRQTFGWHKQEDKLSLSQLEELTGLHRETVSEGIKKAMLRGYVGRRKEGNSYVYGLRVDSRNIRPPDDSGSRNDRPSASRSIRPTKERVKESTPTEQAQPAVSWEESKTGEKQAYLIGYLHRRHVERDLDPPTPRQKERLSGELRTHIQRGRSKADLLFALDHMVEAARRGVRLELYQALSDADGKVRHLRAVDTPPERQWNVLNPVSGEAEGQSG